MRATVIRSGFLTTVQDLGRPEFRKFGVSLGGAIDAHGLRVANLLAGNDESLAGLEVTFGDFRLQFHDERIIAWCGGLFTVRSGGTALPAGHPFLVRPNEEVIFERVGTGCRAWLAISGGIDVPLRLKSRSTDLRANFGGFDGRVLRDEDSLPLGRLSQSAQAPVATLRRERLARWGASTAWTRPDVREPILRVVRGADWSRFDPSAQSAFLSKVFSVTVDSDRMGARLERAALNRSDEGADLVSEAVTPGTIQVPPGGTPIILLADCQTIGGYPKIAHVITVDFAVAAQLRAGDRVRFREVTLAEAHRLLWERERQLEQFRIGVQLQA